jgi:hypothetical protein
LEVFFEMGRTYFYAPTNHEKALLAKNLKLRRKVPTLGKTQKSKKKFLITKSDESTP